MRDKQAFNTLPTYLPGTTQTGTIKLSSNENPFGVSPAAGRIMRKACAELHRYPDSGIVTLRKKIADNFSLEPEQVVVGNGSDEVMLLAAIAFLEAGDEALVGEYTFSVYAFVSQLLTATVQCIPMPDGSYDLEKILARLNNRTRMIFLGNPNNPTGRIINRRMLEELLQAVPRDVLIVMDEAYGEFANDEQYQTAISYIHEYQNLLVLRTFSKIYGLAGVRIGYGLADAETAAKLLRVRLPFTCNTVGQYAATAALGDHGFVQKTQRCIWKERERLQHTLERLGLPYYPSQANFISFQVPEPADIAIDRIAAHGVTLRSLRSFGLDNWLRASIGNKKQNNVCMAALTTLYG